jgi:hypothetical protein
MILPSYPYTYSPWTIKGEAGTLERKDDAERKQ